MAQVRPQIHCTVKGGFEGCGNELFDSNSSSRKSSSKDLVEGPSSNFLFFDDTASGEALMSTVAMML